MDMQTADHQFPMPGPSRIFINVLLKALAATLPAGIAELAPRDEQLEAMPPTRSLPRSPSPLPMPRWTASREPRNRACPTTPR